MKYLKVFAATATTGLLLTSCAISAEPIISTDKLTPLNPAIQKPVQQKAAPDTHQRAMKPLVNATVRPVRAEHSARPARDWCQTHDSTTIEGRVTLEYNYPGPAGGPQLGGIIVVNSNGREYRTNVTIYPGFNKVAMSDSMQFGWRDACPPNRVSVRLLAQSPADKSKFVPVTIYASPDRTDHPDWY